MGGGGHGLVVIDTNIKKAISNPCDAIYFFGRNTEWQCSVDTQEDKIQ